MPRLFITEDKVREINAASDLSEYSHDQLRLADAWIKDFALKQLERRLRALTQGKEIREYILLMSRCHYGSVETDEFLTEMKCYPEWLAQRSV